MVPTTIYKSVLGYAAASILFKRENPNQSSDLFVLRSLRSVYTNSKAATEFSQPIRYVILPPQPEIRDANASGVALLISAASALSTHQSSIQQSPKAYRKDAAQYREQASALREEAAILETELIKERSERDALRAAEEPTPAATTHVSQPVLVASAGDVEVRWALDDDGVLRAKVAAGDATLDLEGSWRASGKKVRLAASGLGVRVACEAPMMETQSVRVARDQRRRFRGRSARRAVHAGDGGGVVRARRGRGARRALLLAQAPAHRRTTAPRYAPRVPARRADDRRRARGRPTLGRRYTGL